jgi:membrane-associated phospholipid phosphatase
MLVAVTLWPLAKRWWLKVPVALFPLSMAFTLVYGGEHYVVDVLMGWLYVAVVMVVAGQWERWRERRRLRPVALSAGSPAPVEPALRTTDAGTVSDPNEPAGRQ